jgi:UDP-N-acetylglucosamine diphosphorylase / glucose-1-phosphate thymidylyltransferase / UDP-N-acetylgalactosamine diphosphorylase / glucosamine-1-phosphate N-acetyltransferase / galactosamine-1-phosphate N-acetyltransferase
MKPNVKPFRISDYIEEFRSHFPENSSRLPWQIVPDIQPILNESLTRLSSDFRVTGNIAIHKSATVEEHAVLKGPLIISANCFIAAHVYLRGGVFLGHHVSLGPGCEIKSSFVFSHSALAHFNYVGDSLLGAGVNLEAGAVVANCFNERTQREVEIKLHSKRIKTGLEKFGALVGDGSKIGANAVLSPGTILPRQSIVKRLQLVEQIKRRS